MRHRLDLAIGPVGFRIGSAWAEPIERLSVLYAGYPAPDGGVPDFTVRLEPEKPWRRWLRPSVAVHGDYMLPEATPLALAHGLLAAEMGMNLQLALGHRRHLLLHAASVERDGQALLITGVSGAGKSTLAALLSLGGWRLLGDEFALLDCATGLLWPFPRAVSLKNESIAAVAARVSADRLGPVLAGTPKGTIRHLRPDRAAVARMREPARPRLILFPTFGAAEAVRAVPPVESFVRLTQASTNYVALGEAGFRALTGLVADLPSVAMDYPDAATGLRLVHELWASLDASPSNPAHPEPVEGCVGPAGSTLRQAQGERGIKAPE